ncbi:hypothetical protein N1851_031493 [Merluccius polli]|uniref:Uncharacterized protein n=1 Tax=Merluccius polli TaxID=89951 RepID=A0AA47M3T8_MERPO|nr:hypothetical protein N1851_031493 [Merluccius polli]
MSTLVALDAGVALLAAAAAPAAPRRQLSLKMKDCRPLLLLMSLAVVDNSFALSDSGWISWFSVLDPGGPDPSTRVDDGARAGPAATPRPNRAAISLSSSPKVAKVWKPFNFSVFLLHKNSDMTPTAEQDLQHMQAGLGKRCLSMGIDMTHPEVSNLFESAFPKMKSITGGWTKQSVEMDDGVCQLYPLNRRDTQGVP